MSSSAVNSSTQQRKNIRFAPALAVKIISNRFLGRDDSGISERRETAQSSRRGGAASTIPRSGTQTPRASILRTSTSAGTGGNRASFSAEAGSGGGIRGGGGSRKSYISIGARSSGILSDGGGSSVAAGSTEKDPPESSQTQFCQSSMCCRLFTTATSCCRTGCAPQSLLPFFSRTITSSIWRYALVFFTVVLLFGQPVQDLWCPKESDVAFDAIYVAAFTVLAADVIMRSVVSPEYFLLQVGGKDLRHDALLNRVLRPRLSTGGSGDNWGGLLKCCSGYRLGSFMFWCDVVSTCSLLYDIAFINTSKASLINIIINVGSDGIPVRWDFFTDDGDVVNLNGAYLINIAKTARIARFARATYVVQLSGKINWFWLCDHLDPLYWLRRLRGNEAVSGGVKTILEELAQQEGTASPSGAIGGGNNSIRRRSSILRNSHPSITNGGGGASITGNPDDGVNNKSGGIFRAFLGFLDFRARAEEKAKRTRAAAKIQRTWRSYREKCKGDVLYGQSKEEGNTLGKGRGSSKGKKKFIRRTLSQADPSAIESSSHNRHVGSEDSHVGSAMRELTAQRVALGIMVALALAVIFTYKEEDQTSSSTMLLLHSQTEKAGFKDLAIEAARSSVVPNLFEYVDDNGVVTTYSLPSGNDPASLRPREMYRILVKDTQNRTTSGLFSNKHVTDGNALAMLVSTIFILLVWFFGVTSFAGPVMTLVVAPIERMIRLLNMLTRDPLGYQSSDKYKKFVREEDLFTKNTKWTRDVLKGMETSFLMSTILRIGSLMKVGFGSAGVEIIRSNLQKGQTGTQLHLNTKGSTVSCIFLFCDIRQFTDATECLQEEVFVFTNKIAAVVHSICHSYEGSANKNIGDAFLLSWELKSHCSETDRGDSFVDKYAPERDMFFNSNGGMGVGRGDGLEAKNNEADKALLSVRKICIALYHDKFFIESIKEDARSRLLTKIAKRKGPVVQMGFGLHAGKAVQGAIGSQRKLDATYVSRNVEMSEFLESSTKKFGLKMLMSDAFHRLLHPSNRRRCRKVDQIMFNDDEGSDTEDVENGDIMELFTFDMDIDALWQPSPKTNPNGESMEGGSMHHMEQDNDSETSSLRLQRTSEDGLAKNAPGNRPNLARAKSTRRRVSLIRPSAAFRNLSTSGAALQETADAPHFSASSEAAPNTIPGASVAESDLNERGVPKVMDELVLPTGPVVYSAQVWVDEEMRKLRHLYSDGLFYQKFSSGLNSFYSRDWEHAQQCFRTILDRFEDGPSRYFLNQIEENNGIPPRNFNGFGSAD